VYLILLNHSRSKHFHLNRYLASFAQEACTNGCLYTKYSLKLSGVLYMKIHMAWQAAVGLPISNFTQIGSAVHENDEWTEYL
jgi:hypothetical protein